MPALDLGYWILSDDINEFSLLAVAATPPCYRPIRLEKAILPFPSGVSLVHWRVAQGSYSQEPRAFVSHGPDGPFPSDFAEVVNLNSVYTSKAMKPAAEIQLEIPIPRQSLVWGLTWPDDNDETMPLLDKSLRDQEYSQPFASID